MVCCTFTSVWVVAILVVGQLLLACEMTAGLVAVGGRVLWLTALLRLKLYEPSTRSAAGPAASSIVLSRVSHSSHSLQPATRLKPTELCHSGSCLSFDSSFLSLRVAMPRAEVLALYRTILKVSCHPDVGSPNHDRFHTLH